MTQEKNPRSLFFRERLANLLAERGISQRQLAEATKLTPQSISNYMRGTRTLPGAEELYALAKYFDVSMESFLQPDGTPSDAKKKAVALIPTRAKVRRIAKRMEHTASELTSLARELLE